MESAGMDDLWGFKVLLLFSFPWKLGSTGVFCKCYQSKLPITAVFKCSEPPLNFNWDECLRLTPNAYIHVIKMLLCWILKSPEVKTMGSLSLYKKITCVFFLKQGLKFFVFYCFFTIINLQCKRHCKFTLLWLIYNPEQSRRFWLTVWKLHHLS